MKRLFVILFAVWSGISYQVYGSGALFQEVAEKLNAIPLVDGKNLFGGQVLTLAEGFQHEKLDQNRELAGQLHARLVHMFAQPVKVARSIFSDELYTPVDYLKPFQELANLARQMNVSALAFFRDAFETGAIYGVRIPGLVKQPDRAAIFTKLYDIRRRMDTDRHPEKVQKVKEELLAAEEQRRAEAAEITRQYLQPSQGGGMVLRKRRAGVDENGLGRSADRRGGSAYQVLDAGLGDDEMQSLLPADQKQ